MVCLKKFKKISLSFTIIVITKLIKNLNYLLQRAVDGRMHHENEKRKKERIQKHVPLVQFKIISRAMLMLHKHHFFVKTKDEKCYSHVN
jgi:midasin (ATPase involved in ribosome maturation)